MDGKNTDVLRVHKNADKEGREIKFNRVCQLMLNKELTRIEEGWSSRQVDRYSRFEWIH